MKRDLSIGAVTAKPGELVKGSLGSVELADGSRASIPLILANGVDDGPVLTVVAGVHGTELSGIGALLRVVRDLDPHALHGSLIAVPGANPLAYRVGEHITPIDGKNLSGPWYPPKESTPKRSITERIGYYINAALDAADYVIDMHANPLPSMPFVLTSLSMCSSPDMEHEVSRLAEAYGVTVIDWPAKEATTIRNICVKRGKPAITPELAGNIFLWKEITDVGYRGIRNVMRMLGMLDDATEPQTCKVLHGDFLLYGWLYAQRGGLMNILKSPGERIERGETVVELLNVYGDVLEEVTMPVQGYCWAFTGGLNGIHAVSEGEKLAYVFADRGNLGSDAADALSDM